MIVYDKEQKQIVIPNGLGNVNIIINGGECPEPNLGDLVKEITENGNYVYYASNDGLDGYNMADIRINVPGGAGAVIQDYKWVRPSMADRAENGDIYIRPDEGFDAVGYIDLDPNDIYNEGVEAGRAECAEPAPEPPQDGWGMSGYFNDWGGSPDIPFEEDGEWDGKPYKVIRNFEAVGGEFKIRRNNAWNDSYTADFSNEPQFARLQKGDINMSINDGVWDIYLFFRNDGEPNEMLILHPGTDLSTIQYEYTLNLSADKENAIIDVDDSYDGMGYRYYGYATVPMKYGCTYSINVHMEGYEDIYDEITCYNDEERNYTLTKIEGGGGGSCNLINPIVFSKEAGNTINAENVQIPTFVYEGNQYYNVDSFNLADIEEFKIHILFKPNNGGYGEPVNIFGCEDTDWDNTTFGARIYEGNITFKMSGEEIVSPYTENAWYDVEMGYNTTKRWVIVNGETLMETEHTEFNKPSKTLMIGAINSGGNAFRPFYGKIAAIYIESNGNQVWLLPKEDGAMYVYWNNRTNVWNSISGDNNARFENDYISGDGMKSITWLGNLEDKWVTPSMSERDDNGYIVVIPSEGYNGLKRTVINPQTIYNEGVAAGKTEKETDIATNARVLNVTENGVYKSKFSDPIIPANYTVTGVYADGTNFYSYAELSNKIFNTKIAGSVDSRLEFWYKGDNTLSGDAFNVIIGSGDNDDSDCFQVRYDTFSNNDLLIGVGNTTINVSGWDDTVWHHLIISKSEGLWIDGEKKGDFTPSNTINGEFFINGIGYSNTRNANGCFGMIKIDDIIIIPTANGFKNVNTGELLEVVNDGGYTFTENLPIYAEGELYKTINVNVVPQISIKEEGLNVWYNDLKRITDENESINSDWDLALKGETIQNVFPGIAITPPSETVAKPYFIDSINRDNTATRIGKLVYDRGGTPISCSVVIIGAFNCKNIQNVDIEAFKYMTDLCFIDGMNGLGESFISPQTINFTYCTNLFIKGNNKKFISNFAESLFDLSTGNKNGINTSTLKFKNAVQEKSENADAIALMQSKGWTVEFVSSDL